MKHRILILEDDPDMREALEYALSDFDCLFCSTLAQGFKEWTRGWDLIILDLSLPDGNGLELLQVVRLESDVPVLVFSGRKEESVILDAYAQKGDDYITKPFGVLELMSRIKAIMRRIRPTGDDMILKYKNICLDQDRRVCLVDEENVELTFKEYELLRLFLSNPGIVLTREIIMETVWGTDFAGESRTIDMHIKTLRKKLKEAGSLIVTVRNVGYKLE